MDVVEEMTKICLEIGVVSNYVTQGRVMCALTLVSQNFKELEKDKTLTHEVMKQRACEEPIQILEQAYEDTLEQIKDPTKSENAEEDQEEDVSRHAFLDKIVFQLGRKYMLVQDFAKAVPKLDSVITMREQMYGENSETLLKPLQSMASCLRLMKDLPGCLATCFTASQIADSVLKSETVKDPQKRLSI